MILRLGVAGVFQVGSEWWSWELLGCMRSLLCVIFPGSLMFVFSGRQPVGSGCLGRPVRPSRFRLDHLPGALCFKHCRCRPRREFVGAIQGPARGSFHPRFVFHCLPYCHRVEVRILVHIGALSLQLIFASSSTMFLVFRNHWAKLFNNDPGTIPPLTSPFRGAE